MVQFKNFIKSYKDFPTEGIVFHDVLSILQETNVFNELIMGMASTKIIEDAEAIISIDARGFIFGTAISLRTSKPMIVARKKGKLPGELVNKSYELEYGTDSLYVQKQSLEKYGSYAIVDDVLATGGTANCVCEILKESKKRVEGLVVVLEIENINGRGNLSVPVSSQIIY